MGLTKGKVKRAIAEEVAKGGIGHLCGWDGERFEILDGLEKRKFIPYPCVPSALDEILKVIREIASRRKE